MEHTKIPQANPPLLDNDFGYWLAGFIDGEGCFSIFKRTRRDGYESGYFCRFTLQVRDDDAEIIEQIVVKSSIGSVRRRSTDRSVIWEVSGKESCRRLVCLLNKYPLRAKKSRDFNLWKQAVELWLEIKPLYNRGTSGQFDKRSRADWTKIAELKDTLSETKKYAFFTES